MVPRRAHTLMTALGALVFGAALAACYFETDGSWWWDWNDDPELVGAEAGCFYDQGVPTWFFEAEVYDYDGPEDIWEVEAWVYDDWDGRLVTSFSLEPTTHRWWWYDERPEWATVLDCDYDHYSVDFVVTDTWDGWDSLTVIPDTF